MTHEQFMELRVGDVVYLTEGSRYEIVELRVSGFCKSDVMLSCKSLIDNSNLYFLYKGNQYYMTANVDLKNWVTFKISELKFFWKNNSEENSIEHFKKKIEETKSELVRLENTLKGLEDSKRMKELTETLSNLIVGDFYTVKLFNGTVFTGKFAGDTLRKKCFRFDFVCDDNLHNDIWKEHIKQIIHRPNFTYDYKSLLNKIDTLNSELENV